MTDNEQLAERARTIEAITARYAEKPDGNADGYYMRAALELAELAAKYGDVPVGCVIVRDGNIIAA
ncbi:MAG: hypothetical protein J6D10_01730, partial [Clostridia bacterium]|nr:hypothetical protein [Clostridia bacterium]